MPRTDASTVYTDRKPVFTLGNDHQLGVFGQAPCEEPQEETKRPFASIL